MTANQPDAGHDRYQSPFSWRYGSREMRHLWSELERRRQMRRVWLALAEAQHLAGVVSREQLDDLRRTADHIDIARAQEIEATTRHDVMAEVLAWRELAPIGGAILHLGATSADITDNADMLRLRESLRLIETRLETAVARLAEQVTAHADTVCAGWTHIQPAAPTTVGYRLALSLDDLAGDLVQLRELLPRMRGKGLRGAVGTGASYAAVLERSEWTAERLEERVLDQLGLPAGPVASQVYSRKRDFEALSLLAGIAASAARLAFNIRLLQSPPFGEWSEGFGEGQVGSTAMPWKRNPIDAENVSSLARYVASLPHIAWENAANSLLERTLDDSANRRVILPEGFLAADEILMRVAKLAGRLRVDSGAVERLLTTYGPFAATERVLLAAARSGGDRQALHETIRRLSLQAWTAVEAGGTNPLADLLAGDPDIVRFLAPDQVRRLVARPEEHVGDAPARARAVADSARALLATET